MSSPLYERLRSYARKNRISFAMPGHKNGRGLKSDLVSLDVTELDGTENLLSGGEYVRASQQLLSQLYGSDKSYILTGGSTSAIQAMICGALRTGETLLASADCHMSVFNACALMGIRVKLIPKEYNTDFSVPSRTLLTEDLLSPDVRAVILTSPNYYGICQDIRAAAELCHRKNIPLLTDEAHGAHFIAGGPLPESAVKYADAVCHSAHKTLNALNGAAYLHLNGSLIDIQRTQRALGMFQSSSPSYPIAASADTSREELSGGNEWNRTCNLCKMLREKITDMGIRVLENDDVTRLVLNFSDIGITGFEAARILSDNGIDIEMSDMVNTVLIVTPSNTITDLNMLLNALTAVTAEKKSAKLPSLTPPPICSDTLNPQPVFFAPHRVVRLYEAEGKTAAEAIVPYPPGVPALFIGETVRTEHIEYIGAMLEAGAHITGINDGKITVKD